MERILGGGLLRSIVQVYADDEGNVAKHKDSRHCRHDFFAFIQDLRPHGVEPRHQALRHRSIGCGVDNTSLNKMSSIVI